MIRGIRTAEGVLYTTPGPPPSEAGFANGLAYSPTNQLYTTTNTVGAVWLNGFMVSPLGELVVAPGGAPQSVQNGVARAAMGGALVTFNPPLGTDQTIARQRVSVDGVLYITATTPPSLGPAFSNGFSGGFDAASAAPAAAVVRTRKRKAA